MNDEKPEDILETPQINRFQHENVFALSFQNELANKSLILNRSSSTIYENTSADQQIDISETPSATPLIPAFAKLNSIIPVTPAPVIVATSTSNATTTTTISTPPISNGNLSSAPKKTLLMRTQSQTDDQMKSQQLDTLKLFSNQNQILNGDINHNINKNNNFVNNNNNNNNNSNNSPQLVDQNNNNNNHTNHNDISDSIIIEDEDKSLILPNRIPDTNSPTTLVFNTNIKNENLSEINKKPIVIKNINDTADLVKNILTAINKPYASQANNFNNNNNKIVTTTQGIPLQVIVKNNNIQQTQSIPINTQNIIASIIPNHKRNSNESVTNTNTKSIKLASTSAPASLIQTSLLNNSIAQNDDILIDTKALITSSSTDSDNSSVSKLSADELSFDSNKKNDANEKRKEKRRSNTVNNEVRKQQIRNSNREAARRCRERRRLYIESLESNIKNLESKQKALANENATLRKEINQLCKMLAQHKDCNLASTLAQNSYFATVTQQQQQQQQQTQQQLQVPVYLLEIPAAAVAASTVNTSASSATPTLANVLTYTPTNPQNIQHH